MVALTHRVVYRGDPTKKVAEKCKVQKRLFSSAVARLAGRSAVTKSRTSMRIDAPKSPSDVVLKTVKNAKIGHTVLPLEGAKIAKSQSCDHFREPQRRNHAPHFDADRGGRKNFRGLSNAAKIAKIGLIVLPLEGAKVGAAQNFGGL